MKRLAVVVNERCNIDCVYCFNSTHDTVVRLRSEKTGLGNEQIIDFVSVLAARSYNSITLTGGEPTISPRTQVWLKALGLAEIQTILITNLVYLPEELTNSIAAHKNLLARISLGGADAATHDRERGRFVETISNVVRLRDRGVHCELTLVLTPENFDRICDFELLCRKLGCDGNIVPVSGALTSFLKAIPESRWMDTVASLSDPRLIYQMLLTESFIHNSSRPTHCALRTQTHVLSQNGDLHGCFFRRDIYFGNIVTDGADSVLGAAWSDSALPATCFGNHCIGIHLH